MFTCLLSAFEEAQYLANEMLDHGQRRSTYLVQYGDIIKVRRYKPANGIYMMRVKPQ